MHANTPQSKKPTRTANYPAGNAESQIVPNLSDTGKVFANRRARFVLAGHTLTRNNLVDGARMYDAACSDMFRASPGLQEAAHFLAQIGGAE